MYMYMHEEWIDVCLQHTLFPAKMTGLVTPALHCLINGSQYSVT